jgi:hypothetical protein
MIDPARRMLAVRGTIMASDPRMIAQRDAGIA